MAWLSHAMTLPACIMHKVFDIQSANFLCLPCLTPFTSRRTNGRSVQTQIPAADTVCLRLTNFCVFTTLWASTVINGGLYQRHVLHQPWKLPYPILVKRDGGSAPRSCRMISKILEGLVRIPCRMWRWVRDGSGMGGDGDGLQML